MQDSKFSQIVYRDSAALIVFAFPSPEMALWQPALEELNTGGTKDHHLLQHRQAGNQMGGLHLSFPLDSPGGR